MIQLQPLSGSVFEAQTKERDTKMTKLILGTTDITTAINSITNRGKKLDADIQLCALSVINHVELHGDPSLMNAMVVAMPKGSRVNALNEFLETFGRVTFNPTTKVFEYSKDGVTDLDGAETTVWTEFKPEPAYKGLDLRASILVLIKKAEERKTSTNKEDKVPAELLTALEALVS